MMAGTMLEGTMMAGTTMVGTMMADMEQAGTTKVIEDSSAGTTPWSQHFNDFGKQ